MFGTAAFFGITIAGAFCTVLLGVLPSLFKRRLAAFERAGIFLVWIAAIGSSVFAAVASKADARKDAQTQAAFRRYAYWREEAGAIRDRVLGQWQSLNQRIAVVLPFAPNAATPEDRLPQCAQDAGSMLGSISTILGTHAVALETLHAGCGAPATASITEMLLQRQHELTAPTAGQDPRQLRKLVTAAFVDLPDISHKCQTAVMGTFDDCLRLERDRFEHDPANWQPEASEERLRAMN
jgi:hypothetical protein